jgi:hypothetical protein
MRKMTRTASKATASRAATATPAPATPAPAPPAPSTAKAPPQGRADAALHPTTPLEVMVSRALDQELEWFYVYAESALNRESVGLIPCDVAASLLPSNPTADALRIKAHELASTVQGCLRALPDRHASVLRAVYTPRRWPKPVEAEFQTLAPLVVRLDLATDPWPARSAHAGLEDAAASRLSARLLAGKPLATVRLKTQASRLFEAAVVAYTKLRALESPALGLS